MVVETKKSFETKKIVKTDHVFIKGNPNIGDSGYWIKKQKKLEMIDQNVEKNVCSVVIFDLNMNDQEIPIIIQKMKVLDISVLFLCCPDFRLSDFTRILNLKELNLNEICLLMPLRGNEMIKHEKEGIVEMGISMFLFLKKNVKYNKSIQQKWSNVWIYEMGVHGDEFGLNEELFCLFESFTSMLFNNHSNINVIGKEKDFFFKKNKTRKCVFI